ncbi:hypothetical protein FHG87_002024 [Trinorchestia longiramus]|nr:hypothetical protein FHG87_002024 [Trinorchestia longiramus]
MATAMADFTALLAAQPPLPISAEMDKVLQNNLFEGRSHASDGRNHLPHFSPATLQFLKKLSPSLQKAALSAFRKTPKTTTSTTHKPKNVQVKEIPYFASTATPTTLQPLHTTDFDKTTSTTLSHTVFHAPSKKPITPDKHSPLRKQKHFAQVSASKSKVTPPSFHWGDIESNSSPFWRGDFSDKTDLDGPDRVNRMGLMNPSNSDDAGIVLLVAIFNLLAVVIYAAHRHVTNSPSLPPRVLDWQVQKVLDELVLRVHSSSGAAKVLAKALPTGLSAGAFGGRSMNLTPKTGLQILDNAKDFMLSIASSPAARNSASLPSGMYRPFTEMYESVSEDLKDILSHENPKSSTEPGATGRQLSAAKTDAKPMWLQLVLGASQLNGVQWDGILRTLTMIGRSRSLISSQIIAKALMTALASPAGSARNYRESFLGNLQSQIEEFYKANLGKSQKVEDNFSERIKRSNDKQSHFSDLDDSRVILGKGLVDDAPSLTGAGGEVGPLWAHRWFSLITRLAPVALDATTLYARAHREPTCLRSLLCSINFSWKKVGPLQAALTPLLSVLTGWALEERMPHSLGDSLESIRSGWLGRNCAILYPECTIVQAPDNIVRQALTYFSRLEFSLNENPTTASFTERSASDSRNEVILHEEDKEVFAHSLVKQRQHEPIHQLRPSKIEHYSLKETSVESESHMQNIPHLDTHQENESQNNGYTNSNAVNVNHRKADQNVDEGQTQSHFETHEIQEAGKPLGNSNLRTINFQERVDHKPLDEDSYELYRKETYGPYLRTSMHINNPDDHLSKDEDTEDLSLNHKMKENEVDYHVREEEKNDHNWHREPLENRPGQVLVASPVQEQQPLYRRYDSPHQDLNEESLEQLSVIAGMDLQDAQLSRAEALTSVVESTNDRREDPVRDDRGPPTSSSADSIQRQQQQQVVYVHQVASPLPVQVQKLNLTYGSSSKPVSRFALQSHKHIYSSPNFKQSNVLESKSRVQQSLHSDSWRDLPSFGSRFETEKFEEKSRKKLRNHFSTVKSRPLLPKSRYLFRSPIDVNSHQAKNVKQSYKQVIIPSAHGANKYNFRDVSRSGISHQQRKNSKRPSGFNSTSTNSFQRPSHSQHSRNLSVESSLRFSNGNEYMKRGEVLPSDVRRNDNTEALTGKTRRKYLYGLRRGLPAVTVENYSLSKQRNAHTTHLRQKTRPWFTYTPKKYLKYPHKNIKNAQHEISATEKPENKRPVEEFGPNDAITDKFKNILLYQYIRDQVKEQPSNSQEAKEEKQESEVVE